jgi:glutamate N-acetyltransferase/amino-acid N-acetyltransferase
MNEKAETKGHIRRDEYTVQGFEASAAAAGLKKDKALDVALIVSRRDAVAAGVFTMNKVKAAPVVLSAEHVKGGTARAIVANAGNANACTGEPGLNHARLTTELVAQALGIAATEVLVASTGVIGLPLNMDALSGAIPELVKSLSPQGMPLAARAIMTTDSFPKMARFEGQVGGRSYRILGMAKGAGMIMPNMATMLCFLVTDIRVDSSELRTALIESVEGTFNRITVDGDTSTNDTVLVMANGLAGNKALTGADYTGFKKGLADVMGALSLMMVRDGEGATKLVRIEVKGAFSASDALVAARTVANSSLVKTAFYGQDPNWGRIMAALGRAEIKVDEHRVDIWVDDVQIVGSGLGKGTETEAKAAERMARKEFVLTIDLHQGDHEDRVSTCDLTHEYISINANYRT